MRGILIASALVGLVTAVTCPADHNKVISSYKIECGINHAGGDVPGPNGNTALTIDACVAQCRARSGCVLVAWLPGPKACYLKDRVGDAYENSSVLGALKVSTGSSATKGNVPVKESTRSSASSPAASSSAKPSTPNHVASSSSKSSIPAPASSSSARTSAAVPAASSPPNAPAQFVKNAGKRGLAYNDSKYTRFFSRAGQGSRVSWAYNWYSTAYKVNARDHVGSSRAGTSELRKVNPAFTYIPMLWSDDSDLTRNWETNAKEAFDEGADAALAFNEPNQCGGGGSCMTVDRAIAAYRVFFSKVSDYKNAGKMAAPAVSNSGADNAGSSTSRNSSRNAPVVRSMLCHSLVQLRVRDPVLRGPRHERLRNEWTQAHLHYRVWLQ